MPIKTITTVLVFASFISYPSIAQETSCYYRSKSHEASFWYGGSCGQINESGQLTLKSELKDDMFFDENELSCLMFPNKVGYLVRPDFKSISVPIWDNTCVWFEEGTAIANRDGRQVYIDNKLRVVLDPGFESLGLFAQGYATVCNGPFQYVQEGEHTRRLSGQCGLINRAGELLVEAIYPSEEYEVFRDYRNAHNECPPPPIDSEESALCHAKRHIRNEKRSDDWIEYSLTLEGDHWAVTFLSANNPDEFTMHIGVEKANLKNIINNQYLN